MAAAQVCATTATILAGLDRVATWRLRDAGLPKTSDAAAILSASHSQQYLLLRVNSGSVVLLRQALEDAALEVLPRSANVTFVPPKERTELQITASCLYHDCSGWLTRTLRQTQPASVRQTPAERCCFEVRQTVCMTTCRFDVCMLGVFVFRGPSR